MTPRGSIHVRAESAVRCWIYEIRELGHNYEIHEPQVDLPLVGPLHLRFWLDFSRWWLVMVFGITRQWRIIVCAFCPMGDTGRTAAAGCVEVVA